MTFEPRNSLDIDVPSIGATGLFLLPFIGIAISLWPMILLYLYIDPQGKAFIRAAREIGRDEDETAFEERLTKIANVQLRSPKRGSPVLSRRS